MVFGYIDCPLTNFSSKNKKNYYMTISNLMTSNFRLNIDKCQYCKCM